ncbi:MAG: YihY/virulence factor BrkB family protein [Nocardioidaceae bacterium]|nr:YihY/virulence factor BrkB family protein [Nocardioidaceae bacterium]
MAERATDTRTDDRGHDDVPGAQADKPSQIPAKGWFQVARRAFAEMGRDHVTLIAGGVAYRWFLALFPGLIAAVMIYGLVTDPAQVQRQIASLAEGLPQSAQSLLTDQMTSIAQGSSSSLSIGLIVSLALALWSASAGMAGLVEAINIAYNEEEGRNFFVKRGLALLLTVGFIVFLAVSVALVAVVPIVLNQLGLGIVATIAAQVVRWVGLVLVMSVALALLYRVGPDRDAPKLSWVSQGAVTATVLWVIASVGFSFYVDNFGSYNETYGSLAGVIVLLLWLWITATVVLLGAEINSEAEGQTARDTTKGDPEPMGQRDAVKADEAPPADR